MKKSLIKLAGGIALAGSLLFSPIQAYAGTEITDSTYYNERKIMQIGRGGEHLEKLKIEREKQSLVVERYILKKGVDPQKYFDNSIRDLSAVFKGNEIKIIGIHSDRSPPIIGVKSIKYDSYSEMDMALEEVTEYLRELKQQGYKALSKIDLSTPCCKQLDKSRLMGIDKLIEDIHSVEMISRKERKK